MTKPPQKPINVITSAISAASIGENGVNHYNAAPSAVALNTPPTNPSTVFDGDSSWAILCRPQSLLKTYCRTSLAWTTSTRNATSNIRWLSRLQLVDGEHGLPSVA